MKTVPHSENSILKAIGARRIDCVDQVVDERIREFVQVNPIESVVDFDEMNEPVVMIEFKRILKIGLLLQVNKNFYNEYVRAMTM